jgi:UDP-glucose 4-epimerase
MRAVLTGGAGFVGSHLARTLLDQGFAVDCVDNLSTGSWANITDLLQNPKFQFFLGRAEDQALIEPLIEGCDVVFHLAASVGVKNIMVNTIHSIENNIFSTSLILKLVTKHKKRIFIFSTSEVFGKSTKFPFHEDDDIVLGPVNKLRWSYAASKLVDDYLALAYYHEKKTAVTIVRLFNTIGTGQVGHYGMVVPRFFQQARANQSITIYGSGKQTRCFTDVRDVVAALSLLMDNPKSHGELINIGSTEEVSILELASRIKDLTRSRSGLKLIPFEEAYGPQFEDMGRRVPSLKKLEEMTGFKMRYTLADTLAWIETYDLQTHENFVVPNDTYLTEHMVSVDGVNVLEN